MTGQPSITEFLLEKIAKTEQAASRVFILALPSDADLRVFLGDHVRAECEAMRRIVEEHASVTIHGKSLRGRWSAVRCGRCGDPNGLDQCEPVDYPCPTLIALASIWADHPDYDEAWRVN